ncbi:RteC domain-containing protein [Sinomicrobium oceani]|uniref:RteC domain-containing protein n=1 Tax=Sinomicrobium oceani TaxID=1150368 RepID=UPI00227D603D|nr:RteC domain-containing protein [Sinomicrobium oceani]
MDTHKHILQQLNKDLDLLEHETEDVLERAEKGIRYSREALRNLRKVVLDTPFPSVTDEIQFFKKTKPRLCSKLIYYAKLFHIESKRPRGSNKSQVKFFYGHIRKLQDYFHDNLEFYHYFRRNSSFLDHQYFLRGKTDLRLGMDIHFCYADEEFSTSHDNTVATILAYDMLIVHLKSEIDKLENYNGMEPQHNPFDKTTKFFWTGNKVDLIEMIYSLHSSAVVNHGKVDIKELAYAFEQLFNIDLGDYYHSFLEIRSRKINPTKFLDLLKASLLQKMQELDG